MQYRIHTRPGRRHHSTVESWDGVVTSATPAFIWSVGKSVISLLCWCDCRDIRVELVNGSHTKGNRSNQ